MSNLAGRLQVLDVIESLTLGGPARSMLAFAKYVRNSGHVSVRVAGLAPADRRALDSARSAGVEVLDGSDPRRLDEALRQADIVQVHFWNNPAIFEFLRRPLPPVRLLIWCHVGGHHPPQVLPAGLPEYADVFIATSPVTLELPALKRLTERWGDERVILIPGSADLQRMDGVRNQPHAGFNVGYIGTVDFAKMHPDFLKLHDLPEIEDLHVIVCGDGAGRKMLEQSVRERGAAGRFEFLGYRQDIETVVSRLDVFGYPLCPDNYSATDLVLQEVMSAGVPPVVFPFGGARYQVDDDVNGIVAEEADDYRQALLRLYRDPQLRERLGEAARNKAHKELGAKNQSPRLLEVFRRLVSKPARPRTGLRPNWNPGRIEGADALIDSLGPFAVDFMVSRSADNIEAAIAAEERIAAADAGLASNAAGGIVHYRRRYPDDPHLRLWTGLVLEANGQNALALAEYDNALKLGLDHWRVHGYLGRTAERLGADDLADAARRRVTIDAPDCLQRFFASG